MLAIIIADVMCVALTSHLIAIGNKVQAVNATPCELFKNAPCLKDSWQIIIPNVEENFSKVNIQILKSQP